MTCIVAIKHKNKVYMGGDSAFAAGWDLYIRPDEKVFRRDSFLIGVAGSQRASNLLRYSLQIPRVEDDLMVYMATTFLDAVRECFKTGGYTERSNEVESISSNFLVGVQGRIFEYDSDLQVHEVRQYAAIGSGVIAASGALFATPKMEPVKRIRMALASAEMFTVNVRGPFQVMSAK